MIKVYWEDTSQEVLIREIEDIHWTWEEYDKSVLEMKRMVSSVKHPVVVLVDCRKVCHVPDGVFNHIIEAHTNVPSNLKGQVVVSENRWIEAVAAIVNHMLPEDSLKLGFARTMEKARKQLERMLHPPKKRRRRIVAE